MVDIELERKHGCGREEKRREEKKWILLLSVDYGNEEVKHVSFEEDRTEDTARGDWGQQNSM